MPEKEEITKLICIMCPMGCELKVLHKGKDVLKVEGNGCPLGIKFAKEELTNPKRVIITTVQVEGGLYPLVPVRSEKPVPKSVFFKILEELRKVKVKAPLKFHQVVLKNAMNTGVNIITTRALPKA